MKFINVIRSEFKRNSLMRLFLVAIALIGIINIFVLNILHVPYRDDWCNTLKSWGALLPNQSFLYFGWTGRFTSSFFLGVMHLLPDFVFIVCNIIVTLAVCFCMARLAVGPSSAKSISAYAAVAYAFLWLFLPDFGEILVWKTGSIVYLWIGALILFWLIPYRDLLLESDATRSPWSLVRLVLFMALSFMVGGGLENTSFCAFLMGCSVIAWRRFKRLSVPAWAYAGVIFVLAGWLILLLAPGNFVRATHVEPFSFHRVVSSIHSLIRFWAKHPLIYIVLAYFIHRILQVISGIECKKIPLHANIGYLFFIFSILNTLALSISPQIPVRSFSGSFFFIICGILAQIKAVDTDEFREKIMQSIAMVTKYSTISIKIAICAIIIIAIGGYARSSKKTIRSYMSTYSNYNSYMDIIRKQKLDMSMHIVLPNISYQKNSRQFMDGLGITQDAKNWTNTCFASFCGVETIVLESDSKK